jgi:hypothetical protein
MRVGVVRGGREGVVRVVVRMMMVGMWRWLVDDCWVDGLVDGQRGGIYRVLGVWKEGRAVCVVVLVGMRMWMVVVKVVGEDGTVRLY